MLQPIADLSFGNDVLRTMRAWSVLLGVLCVHKRDLESTHARHLSKEFIRYEM